MDNTSKASKLYLHSLLQAAEAYNNKRKSFYGITFAYRNKPDPYFQQVQSNGNTLMKHLKDFNGDPRSPINGKLEGVFVSVGLYNGELPDRSPFGNTRVQFPIEAIFNERTNLYFTDFYCMTSEVHYVTLVLTVASSPEDIFCQQNLLRLEPATNPFLRRTSGYNDDRYTTIRKRKFFVEILYTDTISLNRLIRKYGKDMVFFSKTEIIDRGHSVHGGIRKKSSCTICNPSPSMLRNPTPSPSSNQSTGGMTPHNNRPIQTYTVTAVNSSHRYNTPIYKSSQTVRAPSYTAATDVNSSHRHTTTYKFSQSVRAPSYTVASDVNASRRSSLSARSSISRSSSSSITSSTETQIHIHNYRREENHSADSSENYGSNCACCVIL